MTPDLSWLAEGDRPVIAGIVALGLLMVLAGCAVPFVEPATSALGRGRRFVGRWCVRGGRWVAARWDARHAGCPRCDHCHPDQADTARTRRTPGPHHTPARLNTPGDTR